MANQNNGPIYAAAAVLCVLIIAIAFAAVYYGPSRVQVQQVSPKALSSISISASGSAKGLPSRADIYFYINATGNTTAAATANLSSRLSLFNRTISPYLGGNMSLIKTQYYDVSNVYTNRTNATPTYQVQESIVVTLPELSKLNGLLANITVVKGLEVQGVNANLSDAQILALRQQALQAALANATSQATSLIGNAAIVNTTISVNSYYMTPYPLYAAAGSSNSGGPAIIKSQNLYYNGTASVQESIQATFYYRK